ncbi:MAG TPA: carboxymuconolactone decarboxylase family protein [Deferrisomatales bacterium]|nr:carboxymuconolactone decarboxylase family protein [Deferrisomatales bacterium]
MSEPSILKFEFTEVLDPKTRELCALAAAAAGGCAH